MKNSNLVNAGIVGALFLVFKFIEMRFITKENIPPNTQSSKPPFKRFVTLI